MFDEAAILSGLDRALNEKVRELNMGKLSSVAARIAEAKKQLELEADKLAAKVEALNAKAPEAFNHAHGILDQHNADLDSMDSELRQISNLPPL